MTHAPVYTREVDLEAVVMDEIRATFGKEVRTEIHASDLVMPRKAYWQRVDPRPASDDEIGFFVAGRGHEDAIARIQGWEKGDQRVEYGISFRPDFYSSIPIEWKTRRRSLARDGEEASRYDNYAHQISYYCALTDHRVGWLWIMSLAETQADGSTKPEFRIYKLEWTPEQMAAIRQDMLTRRTQLTIALDTAHSHHSHKLLPLCPAWACGKQSRTMATKPFCETCEREFDTEWGANRHVTSKTGDGHTMRDAAFSTSYQPRCKWHSDCKPWLDDPKRGGETTGAST